MHRQGLNIFVALVMTNFIILLLTWITLTAVSALTRTFPLVQISLLSQASVFIAVKHDYLLISHHLALFYFNILFNEVIPDLPSH